MGKKVNLVFDATILANGANKNSGRSGIYFTAINIFKELLKHDEINLLLYCQETRLSDLKIVLNELNVSEKCILFSNKFVSFVSDLKNKKYKFKEENKNLQKFLMQLILIVLSPISKKINNIVYKKHIEKLNKNDAYLSLHMKKPDNVKIKSFVMLYDLIPMLFPECHNLTYKKGAWIYDLCESLNTNDNYFAISDCTRNDFLKHFPVINPDKIMTTLLACNDTFKPQSVEEIQQVRKKYNIPNGKKYVFSLCTLEPRKNLIRAVKTFIEFIRKNNINDLVFVLGGGHWEEFIGQLEQEIKNLGSFQDKIFQLGYVEDNDLPALYSGAEWVTYTSQYEGFGLPPLEAMSCGCPVIASNNSSLPEVVGNSAITIDYDSDRQHIEAYEKYYYDENLRKNMSQKGLERSKQFSWEKCTNQILEVIKSEIQCL